VIEGIVRKRVPLVSLTVHGERDSLDVEFLVDTGYTGFLSVPTRLLESIGATAEGPAMVSMADGTLRDVTLYTLNLEWDGDELEVEAVTVEDHPLLGCKMLEGYHLSVEMSEGGEVIIEPL
jgi:clan AA aspartic protease